MTNNKGLWLVVVLLFAVVVGVVKGNHVQEQDQSLDQDDEKTTRQQPQPQPQQRRLDATSSLSSLFSLDCPNNTMPESVAYTIDVFLGVIPPPQDGIGSRARARARARGDEPAPLDCSDEEATKIAFYVNKTLNMIDISKALGVAQLNAEICLNPVNTGGYDGGGDGGFSIGGFGSGLGGGGDDSSDGDDNDRRDGKTRSLFLRDTPTAFHFVHYRGQGTCYFCLPDNADRRLQQETTKTHHSPPSRRRHLRTTSTTKDNNNDEKNHHHNKEANRNGFHQQQQPQQQRRRLSSDDESSEEDDNAAHSTVPKPSRRPTHRPTPSPTFHGTAASTPTWRGRYQQWHTNTYGNRRTPNPAANNPTRRPTQRPSPQPTPRPTPGPTRAVGTLATPGLAWLESTGGGPLGFFLWKIPILEWILTYNLKLALERQFGNDPDSCLAGKLVVDVSIRLLRSSTGRFPRKECADAPPER